MWTAEDRTVDRLLIEQLTELLGKESIAGGDGGGGGGRVRILIEKTGIYLIPENGSAKDLSLSSSVCGFL
jgi:hypothetical protein